MWPLDSMTWGLISTWCHRSQKVIVVIFPRTPWCIPLVCIPLGHPQTPIGLGNYWIYWGLSFFFRVKVGQLPPVLPHVTNPPGCFSPAKIQDALHESSWHHSLLFLYLAFPMEPTVDGGFIRHPPVEVGSLFQLCIRFLSINSRKSADFQSCLS